MTNKEKIGVAVGYVFGGAATAFISFRAGQKYQLKIDQDEMDKMFEEFIENDLPELVKAEKEAMMAREKPNLEFFTDLYKGKMKYDEEPQKTEETKEETNE